MRGRWSRWNGRTCAPAAATPAYSPRPTPRSSTKSPVEEAEAARRPARTYGRKRVARMMWLIQWLNDLPVATGAVIVIGGGIAISIIGTLIVNSYLTPAQ